MLNLLLSLETLIKKLKSPAIPTVWSAYYEEASLRNEYLDQKKELVNSWISDLSGIHTAVDTGANNGEFSRILAEKNIFTIASDADPSSVNTLYLNIRNSKEQNIQPLILDFSNPSPSIGFNNSERKDFMERANGDMVMALAFIHHLVIGKNISLEMIAEMFNALSRKYLLIEFVPKEDEKAQLMLQTKKDIYTDYTIERFEQIFSNYFSTIKKEEIGNSGRTLFLMSK